MGCHWPRFDKYWNWHSKLSLFVSAGFSVAIFVVSLPKKGTKIEEDDKEWMANWLIGLLFFSGLWNLQGTVYKLWNKERREDFEDEVQLDVAPPITIAEHKQAIEDRNKFISKQKTIVTSLRNEIKSLKRTTSLLDENVTRSSLIHEVLDLEGKNEDLLKEKKLLRDEIYELKRVQESLVDKIVDLEERNNQLLEMAGPN